MKKQVNIELEEYKKQADEWKGKYLRALADYQNLEKWINEERKEVRAHAADQMISEVLVILDSLEKAYKHLKDEGLRHILDIFYAILKSHNVRRLEVRHRQFNPQEMECVEVEESEKDGEVLEEIRAGYLSGNKILRVAQVKVGKKKIDEEAEKLAQKELQKGDYI